MKWHTGRSIFDRISNLKLLLGYLSHNIHGKMGSCLEWQLLTVTLFPLPEGVTVTNWTCIITLSFIRKYLTCFRIAETSQYRLAWKDVICLDISLSFFPSPLLPRNPTHSKWKRFFFRPLLPSLSSPFTLPVAATAASHFAARHLSRMYNSRFLL